jgi:hypothetical protein
MNHTFFSFIKKNSYSALILLLVVSCDDKKNDPKPAVDNALIVQVVKNIPANPTDGTGTGHYTFYSLKNNTVVQTTDSASTQWDIAFNSTTIIVNSGISGPGDAAVQIYTGIFSDLSEAPVDGYKQDNSSSLAIPTGSGNGWYNYNSDTHVISAIPGRVLVIKTAQGKYAKMELISYYKDVPTNPTSVDIARYYSFRYSYQDDGSRNLK